MELTRRELLVVAATVSIVGLPARRVMAKTASQGGRTFPEEELPLRGDAGHCSSTTHRSPLSLRVGAFRYPGSIVRTL